MNPGNSANHGWTYRDRVQRDAEGWTVLEFYVRCYPHSSPEAWKRRIDEGLVLLDGKRSSADARLRTGQVLTYHRPPWKEPEAPLCFGLLHEDEHLIAVAKPAGLPVLPGGDFLENTLLFLVRRRYPDRPAPIHRLGRGTSGLVLFARSALARRRLSADLASGRMTKVYRALVHGVVREDEFTVELPIGKVPYPPLGYLYAVSPDGKPARTECRVAERRPGQTLLDVVIPTGRPHQIRIHLAAVGHPLIGEPLYRKGGMPSPISSERRPPLPGDCGYYLHAWKVSFVHPGSDERLTLSCLPPPLLRRAAEAVPPGPARSA